MSKNDTDGGAATPAEVLECAKKVAEARVAYEVLAMSNANAGNANEKLARRVACDVAQARLHKAEAAYNKALIALSAREAGE